MTDLPFKPRATRPAPTGLASRLNRLIGTPRFQAWAARHVLTRRLVRRDGARLFDLVAGFCHSQVLMALVELRIPEKLLDGARDADELARTCALPEERMRILLRAGVACGLLRITKRGQFALTRSGAALTGVPGLQEMILHHKLLYRDLSDPVAFFRGETETELAAFWPYVFGADGQGDAEVAARYSRLMAQSQLPVIEDTLDAVDLSGTRVLMDVGGGTGAFLSAACRRMPDLRGVLFDLPEVVAAAPSRLAGAGLSGRVRIAPGSFRDDSLPEGADAVSLVRVLYDHGDDTVAALLARLHAVLPKGGTLIVSEPMTGGARPERAGDAYFALYTLAMRTGRARSAEEISTLCHAAGFAKVTRPAPRRPYITRVVLAEKTC